jgi:hypothetical protein
VLRDKIKHLLFQDQYLKKPEAFLNRQESPLRAGATRRNARPALKNSVAGAPRERKRRDDVARRSSGLQAADAGTIFLYTTRRA